jgi:hypothetical protein
MTKNPPKSDEIKIKPLTEGEFISKHLLNFIEKGKNKKKK